MALRRVESGNTLLGDKLNLTAEQEEKCLLLYREKENGIYEFEGFYNPDIEDEDYPDGIIALRLRSVYGGTHTFNQGDSVWNVEGSSHDYWNGEECKNWLAVWHGYFPTESKDKCYVEGSPAGRDNHPQCVRDYVGGHMIRSDKQPGYGDDGKVYIIPICRTHNHYRNKREMTVSESVSALVLNRYHLPK